MATSIASLSLAFLKSDRAVEVVKDAIYTANYASRFCPDVADDWVVEAIAVIAAFIKEIEG